MPYRGKMVVTKKNQATGKKEETLIELNAGKKPSMIKYPDGRVYMGKIDGEKFVPHGHGKVTFSNKSSYNGEWKNGEMHGRGKF